MSSDGININRIMSNIDSRWPKTIDKDRETHILVRVIVEAIISEILNHNQVYLITGDVTVPNGMGKIVSGEGRLR